MVSWTDHLLISCIVILCFHHMCRFTHEILVPSPARSVLVRAMSPARSPEALAEKTIAKATAQGGEETGRGDGGGGRGTGVRK